MIEDITKNMKKITTTNDGYYVIEENPTEPVLTIEEIDYYGRPFLQHNITSWGGAATLIEEDDNNRFNESLGRSIRYVKEHCEGGGNLG